VNPSAFKVVLIDSGGRMSLRYFRAENREQACVMASSGGLTVVQCDEELSNGRFFARLAKSQLFTKKVAIDTVSFSQDLATLLEAGLTVREAIRALSSREKSPQRHLILEGLAKLIAEGCSFSDAMARTGSFPELLVATVAASEQTGDLETGLSRYAKHQQSLRGVRDRVIGACVYPVMLLAVGSLVVALLLGVVVPRFATLIDSRGRELPFLSSLLMSWGQLVDSHPLVPILVLSTVFITLTTTALRWRIPEVRRKWLTRIPGVAGVVREFQHLQMYRTAAILTSRGIPIHKALSYTTDLLSPIDANRLLAGLRDMREGSAISSAFSNCGLSDDLATSMLSVAERTGALPEMLDRIADMYERTLQRNIDIVSRLIEPVLMIIFGILIGGIVVLMYLPIFDLASSIS
jgi:general secretion pathway protein F